jgi:large subunit ribosomal protein L35
MPKMKTHSGTKKRFRVSTRGKVKYKKPGQRHLMTGDSGNQNRHSRRPSKVVKSDIKIIKQNLPYNF